MRHYGYLLSCASRRTRDPSYRNSPLKPKQPHHPPIRYAPKPRRTRKARPQPPRPPPRGLYEALERETERICQSAAIKSEPIHRSKPAFAFTFNWHRGEIGTIFPVALKALSTVLAHSFLLNTLPKLKVKLWTLDLLLEAFSGDLGNRLISLDMGDSHFSSEEIEKFCAFLSDPNRLPKLMELRLVVDSMDYQAYASIRRALGMNKELRIVQLLGPSVDPERADEQDLQEFVLAVKERMLIDESNNGELPPTEFPLTQKLAFVSAIRHESVVDTPRHDLDSFMVASIFKFAADDVRRQVLWIEPY